MANFYQAGDTRYQIRLLDNSLNPVLPVNDFTSLDYVGAVNGMGILQMVLPFEYYPYLLKDRFLTVNRSVNGGPFNLEFDQIWMIRLRGRSSSGRVKKSYLKAYDAKHLMARKINPNYAGSAQSTKTAPADNMAKAVVRENLGTLAAAARQLPTANFSVQPDLSLCPSITDSFAYKTILTAVDDIAQASAANGTFMAYDLVYIGGGQFEFRTYASQRGSNRTRSNGWLAPVIVSEQQGSLAEIDQSEDWSEEATIVYCGGQGEGVERYVSQAPDSTRISGPFGRFEFWADARNSELPAAVDSEAKGVLRVQRVQKKFSSKFVQTPAIMYGRDVFLGDVITASAFGDSLDIRLDSVHVAVAEHKENLEINLVNND